MIEHAIQQPLPAIDSCQRYSVAEAIRYLKISKNTFYRDVADGAILTIKHRRRRFVSGAEIKRLSAA